MQLERFDTAAGLWPQLIARAGLTGARDGDVGPYDAGLLDALRQALFGDRPGHLDRLIGESDLSAEALLRAFFATLEPFARMKEDILALLADAGARASGDQLRIRFDFDGGAEPLDLLLENFRSQMERFASVFVPALPPIDYDRLWQLTRAGYEDTSVFRSELPVPSRPAAALDWLAAYNDGASFPLLGGGWETGDARLDARLGQVVALLNAMLARFATYGRSHEELQAAGDAGRDMRDESGFTVRELWIIESDFWPRAVAEWICRVHDSHAAQDGGRLEQICARVDAILPEPPDAGVERLARVLEDVLDLPVWKHRHEVYAVWLGAQIHRALSAAGWRFRFHLVDDRLEFAFRGVHLASLRRGESEPDLFWWTELRTDHPDLPNTHRTTGIQPDYRVQRSPLSDSHKDVLVVEAKQHLRSSNREFREALEDYAHACPSAGVLLANHGPCSKSLMSQVAAAARERSAAYGEVHPGDAGAVDQFRQCIARVVDFALAGDVARAFELPFGIRLGWNDLPADLDLHLFGGDGRHVHYAEREFEDIVLTPDEQSGRGPEVATLTGAAGTYTIAVHQFSEDGDLSCSGAAVELEWGSMATPSGQRFEVPAGDGKWWHVATVDLASRTVTPLQHRSFDPPRA